MQFWANMQKYQTVLVPAKIVTLREVHKKEQYLGTAHENESLVSLTFQSTHK